MGCRHEPCSSRAGVVTTVSRFATVFFVLLTLEGRARAVTITTDTSEVTRVASDGSTPYSCPGRGPGATGCIVDATFQGVGVHDCNNDTEIVVPLAISGLPDPTVTFEVWAGTGDCTEPGATNNASTATCWLVVPPLVPQPMMQVPIRVADLVGNLGVSPPPQSYQSVPTSTACINPGAGTGETTVNVFFMFFPNGSPVPTAASSAYPVKVKLVGPPACTDVTETTGQGEVFLRWAPPADSTVAGFDLFAAPTATCGTGISGFTCSGDAGSCIQVAGTSQTTQGTIPGLTDGTTYSVAVAAFDEFGNVGAASEPMCATPEPTSEPEPETLVGCTACTLGAESERRERRGGLAMALMAANVIIAARRRRR